MYSAVHHEGRRLYELAREGVEVERAPRAVVVTVIEVQAVGATSATLRIVCGKGTYVRVLAAELGSALGCGGVVEGPARTPARPLPRCAAAPGGRTREAAARAPLGAPRPPRPGARPPPARPP